uniref:OX-2 membrane glycoprotein-like n=1 Tax=Semicossyphus pulcher TaxID=241346 RepID=UPI0037E8F652
MAHRAVILFLCASGHFQEGLTALIQTQRTVCAAAGDQACLNCLLMETKTVHQVTWQKVTPEGEMNIGTYNKYSGERVNPGYQGKVELKVGGLQNTSIVIREVTEQDEGCYRCLFNTYPDGALIDYTCLKLYELHGPVLDVRVSSEEAVVSCSATGRPAPTVTLSVLQLKLVSSDHVHTNTNGTVTVTRTAVLSRHHNNSAQVECAVQVLSVPPKKVSVTIPEVKQTSSSDALKAESGSDNYITTWVVVGIVLVAIVLIAAILCLWKQQWKRVSQKDPEEIETPLKSTEDRPETRTPATARGTPLVQQLNEQTGTRQRTSTVKKKDNNVPKGSKSSPKVRQKLSRLFCNKE